MTPEHSARTNDRFRIDWPLLLFWVPALGFCIAFWTGVIFWIWS